MSLIRRLLTTDVIINCYAAAGEASWHITSVVSVCMYVCSYVCQTITFEIFNEGSLYSHMRNISWRNG